MDKTMESARTKGPITRSKSKKCSEDSHKINQGIKRHRIKGKLSNRLKTDQHKCHKGKMLSNIYNPRRKTTIKRKLTNLIQSSERQYGSKNRLSKRQTTRAKVIKPAEMRVKVENLKETPTVVAVLNSTVENYSKYGENVFQVHKIAEFRCKLYNSHAICPISDDKAWVALNYDGNIYLYNKRGELEETLAMPGRVDDITVQPDGSLLVTNFGGCKVWTVNKTYKKIKEVKILSKEPFLCLGIHWTENGTFICYTDNLNILHGIDSERFILKLGNNGKILKKFERISEEEEFEFPNRVCVNVTGDVLVVDHGRKQLVIFDESGREKLRYPDRRLNSEIYGVCCNLEGFIFVSDHRRHCVDALYPDGSFCQTVVNLRSGNPNGIAVDKTGNLWVGFYEGIIRIFNVTRR